MGAVVLLAGGGLIVYISSSQRPGPSHHAAAAQSAKVLQAQTIGLVDVGPYDDGDSAVNDWDDHPMMLRLTSSGLEFVGISRHEISDGGPPLWTADQMADGTEIFIYSPSGQCLAASANGQLGLEHCNLGRGQRWRAGHPGTAGGLPFDQYANLGTGRCLSAGPKPGAPPQLASCGATHTKPQEIGFWWSA